MAVFGRKDYQQLLVIGRMVRDLDFGVRVVGGPIAREPDGLAMSRQGGSLPPGARPPAARAAAQPAEPAAWLAAATSCSRRSTGGRRPASTRRCWRASASKTGDWLRPALPGSRLRCWAACRPRGRQRWAAALRRQPTSRRASERRWRARRGGWTMLRCGPLACRALCLQQSFPAAPEPLKGRAQVVHASSLEAAADAAAAPAFFAVAVFFGSVRLIDNIELFQQPGGGGPAAVMPGVAETSPASART